MPDLMGDPTIGSEPGGSFDFDNHRAQAVQAYQRLRPLYEAFAGTVQDILIEALRDAGIKAASVEARAKRLESFGNKAAQASESGPELPKYPDPIHEITDLAGVRVITFFLDTVNDVDRVIKAQFSVLERLDKSRDLVQEERLGYQSVHYLVELK